ncbi:2-phospho-L-lactate guanylyltransferase [Streptomyces sp. NPDC002574]|uniref:2-phospho-L-lactate guanylyltransferase n=1 Tax=Streptomyces sp. NPDC002574 TaxID=3364652 RepID=UPI0036950D6B
MSSIAPPAWTLVLPVKPFTQAKSRLATRHGIRRSDLARAFFEDTLGAVRTTTGVGSVLVVTADRQAAAIARSAGALTVPDEPQAGLNAAIRTAVRHAQHMGADGPIAVLTCDLPALRGAELAEVLDAAAGHARAFLADHTRRGTTLLAAAHPRWLEPSFEGGSRDRHLAAGAFEITDPQVPGARLDVDTLDDLRRARQLGLGRHTRAVLGQTGTAVPRSPGLTYTPVREGTAPHGLH